MAYGAKYRIEWASTSGLCRVDLLQSGYTGDPTALQAAEKPLTITWGSGGEDDLTAPWLVSDAELGVVGDARGEQLAELFDSGDREWKLRFEVDRGSGYELEWIGYVATDLWGAHPAVEGERIKVEAVDGLALLQNEDAYVSSGGAYPDSFTPSTAIDRLLRGYGSYAGLHTLDVYSSMAWDSYDLNLPDGESALDYLHIPNRAYLQLGDGGTVEGTLDAETQLKDICERFGLQLFQASGRWYLRQRGQIGDGSALSTWIMPKDGGSSFNPATDLDIRATLPAQVRTSQPQTRVSRLRQLTSTYQYENLQGLVANAGFEDGLNAWDITEPSDGDTTSTVDVLAYDDTLVEQESTQENANVARVTRSVGGSSAIAPPATLSQEAPSTVYDAGPFAALRMSWEEGHKLTTTRATVELEIGGYYLQRRTVEVTSEALPADTGRVRIAGLPTSDQVVIPGGALLYVLPSATDPREDSTSDPMEVLATIELDEPAAGGASELRGRVSDKIPAGSYVQFYTWSTSATDFPNPRLISTESDEKTMIEQEVSAPARTLTGDVVAGTPRVSITIDERDPKQVADRLVFLDNIRLELTAGGDTIEATRYTSLDDQFGRSEEITHRVGRGPVADHPRALFDPGTSSLLGDWKASPYNGGSASGLGLEELTARRWMRQQRSTLDRRTWDVIFRGGERLLPHHVVEEDGRTYTVTHLSRTWGSGNDNRATVELTEKRDDGVDGLQQAYVMESRGEASSTAGGGTVVSSGTQGSEGGVVTWEEVREKPSFVNSFEGRTSDVSLLEGDITGALGFDPLDPTGDSRDLVLGDNSLSLGDGLLQGNGNGALEVLASNGTNHGTLVVEDLVIKGSVDQKNTTELSVDDQYIVTNAGQSGTPSLNGGLYVERGDASDAYLEWDEGLDAFGRRMENGSFDALVVEDGTRWGIDISGDAGSVDGYEGADLAALAENETFTNGLSVTGGNFGIGTTTPNDQLHLKSARPDIRLDDSSDDAYSRVRGAAGGLLLLEADPTNAVADSDLRLTVDGTEIMRLKNGRAGVLTTDPQHALDVAGTTQTDGQFRTKGAGTGFSNSGAIIQSGTSWLDSLNVRGSLFATEFEIRKIDVARGEHIFGPGGGTLVDKNSSSVSDADKKLTFEEETGIKAGDVILTKEVNASDGQIAKEVYGYVVQSDDATKTIHVNVKYNSSTGFFDVGDDVAVIGSQSDGSRDSLVYLNPFKPAIDMLDGINSISAWQSRSPTVRMGVLDGLADLSDGTTPTGAGFYATGNAYLEGTIVAQSGEIGDLVLEDGALTAGSVTGGDINLAADANSFHHGGWDGTPSGAPAISMRYGSNLTERIFAHMGETYSAGWTGRFGFSIAPSKGSEALFEISRDMSDSSLTAQIAGWEITSDTLVNPTDSISIGRGLNTNHYGVQFGSFRSQDFLDTGLLIKDDSGQVQLGFRDNDKMPGMTLYADGDNWMTFGRGHNRTGSQGMGVTMEVDGGRVLYTDDSGKAYIDNLEVRGNATIREGVQIGTRSAAQAVSSDDNILAASDDGRTTKTSDHTNDGWGYYGDTINLEARGVSPGDTLSFSFKMKVSGDYGWKMGGVWRDENGNEVATEYGYCGEFNGNGDEWKRYTGHTQVPSGATRFELRFSASNDATSGTLEAKHFKVNKGPDATDWTPSYKAQGVTNIDGGTIETGTITADEIDTGAITADVADVDSLLAENATIDGNLTLDFGDIRNKDETFLLDDDGLKLDTVGEYTAKNAIRWVDDVNAITPGTNASITTYEETGVGDVLSLDSNDMIDFKVSSQPDIRIAHTAGGVILIFKDPVSSTYTDADFEDVMEAQEGAIGAVNDGQDNVNLIWAETDRYGNITNIDENY